MMYGDFDNAMHVIQNTVGLTLIKTNAFTYQESAAIFAFEIKRSRLKVIDQ